MATRTREFLGECTRDVTVHLSVRLRGGSHAFPMVVAGQRRSPRVSQHR